MRSLGRIVATGLLLSQSDRRSQLLGITARKFFSNKDIRKKGTYGSAKFHHWTTPNPATVKAADFPEVLSLDLSGARTMEIGPIRNQNVILWPLTNANQPTNVF